MTSEDADSIGSGLQQSKGQPRRKPIILVHNKCDLKDLPAFRVSSSFPSSSGVHTLQCSTRAARSILSGRASSLMDTYRHTLMAAVSIAAD